MLTHFFDVFLMQIVDETVVCVVPCAGRPIACCGLLIMITGISDLSKTTSYCNGDGFLHNAAAASFFPYFTQELYALLLFYSYS